MIKVRIWFKKDSHRPKRMETIEAGHFSLSVVGLSFFNVDENGKTIYPAWRNISTDQIAEWRVL